MAFAALLIQVSTETLLRERTEEAAGVLGMESFVDELGGFFAIIVLAIAVLCPLVLLWHVYLRWGSVLAWLTPTDGAAQRNRVGLALFHQGAPGGAIAEFTEALRLNPCLAAAHANRGVAFLELGKLDEALRDLDTALDLNSNLFDALCWRGLIWSKKGDHARALADYDRALHRQPNHPGMLGNRGMARAHLGDFDRALEDLNRAMALGATQGNHYTSRGSIWLARNEYDCALSDLTEAIARGDTSAVAFSNRGMAWLSKGETDRAIADFDEALRQQGHDALAFNNRGFAFRMRGDYGKAVADFEESIRLTPEFPNPYKNLAWLLATCPQAEFRDGARAVAHAQKALQLVKHQEAEWLGILAAAHAEAGAFDQAVHWQTQCLERSPAEKKRELEARLDLYRAGQPFRDTAGGIAPQE
jgi:tetratricopeptide (TPR) repeat protein